MGNYYVQIIGNRLYPFELQTEACQGGADLKEHNRFSALDFM